MGARRISMARLQVGAFKQPQVRIRTRLGASNPDVRPKRPCQNESPSDPRSGRGLSASATWGFAPWRWARIGPAGMALRGGSRDATPQTSGPWDFFAISGKPCPETSMLIGGAHVFLATRSSGNVAHPDAPTQWLHPPPNSLSTERWSYNYVNTDDAWHKALILVSAEGAAAEHRERAARAIATGSPKSRENTLFGVCPILLSPACVDLSRGCGRTVGAPQGKPLPRPCQGTPLPRPFSRIAAPPTVKAYD